MIDLNHLQEDLYTIDKQPIAIAQLLFDTLALFNIHIKTKELVFKSDIQEDLIISGDPKRIQQIFYNTIDNAIKYSVESGDLSISLKKEESYVQFQVTNVGLPIDKQDLERIGERFFRTDKARNRTTGGTGLGLSIVKEIVRLHNGTFTMTSDAQNGTTVTIQLPSLSADRKEEV